MPTTKVFANASIAAFVLALSGCGGASAEAPPPTIAVPAPEPEEKEAVHISSIEVYSKDGTEILVDGKSIGQAPIQKHEVPPGHHDVTFVDPETGNRTMSVDLEPGDHRVLQSDPPPSARNATKPEPSKKEK
jgi:hypothetical protein